MLQIQIKLARMRMCQFAIKIRANRCTKVPGTYPEPERMRGRL